MLQSGYLFVDQATKRRLDAYQLVKSDVASFYGSLGLLLPHGVGPLQFLVFVSEPPSRFEQSVVFGPQFLDLGFENVMLFSCSVNDSGEGDLNVSKGIPQGAYLEVSRCRLSERALSKVFDPRTSS